MKTRIFKTKFWTDTTIRKLSSEARLLFIYLITNPFVSLTSYYEIDNGQILIDTGLDNKRFLKAKKELEENRRSFFYNGWVFIPNLDKHNPYWKSDKTRKAYDEELKNIPNDTLDYFKRKNDSSMDSTINTTINSTPKTKNINHNTKNINNKTENINNNLDNSHSISSIHSKDKDVEIARTIDYLLNQDALAEDYKKGVFSKYNVSIAEIKRKAEELYNYCQAKGKRYKDYRAFLRNAIVRDFGYKFRN